MDVASAYLETHEHLADLVAALPRDQLETVVTASPAWTVKDVVAHVTGIACDVTSGRFPPELDPLAALHDAEQAAVRDRLTAHQVEARRDRPLDEVIDEWRGAVERLLPMIRGERPFPTTIPFAGHVVTSDLATHAQDVRGAVRRPGDRDSAGVGVALASYVAVFGLKVDLAGLPPVRIRYGDKERIAGRRGEPAATWSSERFEIYRALAGRRSIEQIRAMDWDGDPASYLPLVNAYGPREDPIVE